MIRARVLLLAALAMGLGMVVASPAQDALDSLLEGLGIAEDASTNQTEAAAPAPDSFADPFADQAEAPEAAAEPETPALTFDEPEIEPAVQPAGDDPLADLFEPQEAAPVEVDPVEAAEAPVMAGTETAELPAVAPEADPFADLFNAPESAPAGAEELGMGVEQNDPVAEEGAVAEEEAVAEWEMGDQVAEGEAAPATAVPEDVANRREVVLRAREVSGLKALESGYADLHAGRHAEAITQFNRALRDIPVRPATDEARIRADWGLSEANFRIAERQWETYRTNRSGEALNEASAKIDAALQHQASHRAALRLKTRIDKELAEGPRRQDVKDLPEVVQKQSNVEDTLLRGREFFEAGELERAEVLFKQVLLEDDTNRTAIRFLKRIADVKYDIRTSEMEMSKADAIAEVRRKWNPPIRIPQAGETGFLGGQVTPDRVSASDLLRKKMEGIIIPLVQFRGANIQDVVTFLVDASVAADPDKVGVNVILNLNVAEDAGAAAPAADAFADPFGAADPFADPFGGAPAAPAPAMDAGAGGAAGVPKITLSLRRVSMLDAIRFVTEVANLKYRIEGSVVIITPESTVSGPVETRIYPVQPSFMDLVVEQRETAGPDRQGSGGGEFIALGAQQTQMTRGDVRAFFEKAGVPFPRGTSVVFNPSISSLIVANTAENLAIFERILSQINVIPPQIEIEARFIEVVQSDLKQLGLEWILTDNYEMLQKKGSGPLGSTQRIQMDASSAGFTGGNRFFASSASGIGPQSRLGSGSSPSYLGSILSISGVLTNPELRMVLHAIDQSGNVDLLSSPRVTTRNGINAQIQVVREIIYPNEFTSQSAGGGTGQFNLPDDFDGNVVTSSIVIFPAAFETRETGVILNVTPTVGPDGYTIELQLTPEVAELVDWIQYGTEPYNVPQPIFASRKVTTSINIWDGQTVVMGGMIKEDVVTVNDKIPILGDIPILGRLFRTEGERSRKENLMIFVTARIVDPAGNPIRKTRDLGNLSFLQSGQAAD